MGWKRSVPGIDKAVNNLVALLLHSAGGRAGGPAGELPMKTRISALPVCILFLVSQVSQFARAQVTQALPGDVKAVWSLESASREATPTRERVCINGLWRWQPAGGAGGADAAVPVGGWGDFKGAGGGAGGWGYGGGGGGISRCRGRGRGVAITCRRIRRPCSRIRRGRRISAP